MIPKIDVYFDMDSRRLEVWWLEPIPRVLDGWIKYCLICKYPILGMAMDQHTVIYIKDNVNRELYRLTEIGCLFKCLVSQKWRVNLRD